VAQKQLKITYWACLFTMHQQTSQRRDVALIKCWLSDGLNNYYDGPVYSTMHRSGVCLSRRDILRVTHQGASPTRPAKPCCARPQYLLIDNKLMHFAYLRNSDDERIISVEHVIGKHQIDERLRVRVETEILVIVATERVTYNSSTQLLLHPFNGLFSGTTWVSRYQKGKPSWICEARDDGVWGCSGISWTICKQPAPRS